MKVLFLSSWFPNRIQPLNGDFVERHALSVSRICDTAVVHVQADDTMKTQFFEVVEKDKITLHEIIIYFKRNNSRIKLWARTVNLFRYGRGYRIGFRILRHKFGKPDIIHANLIYPVAVVAWGYSMFTAIPYIISEHWTQYLSENISSIPSSWIMRLSAKNAFAVVPVTSGLEQALRRHGYGSNFTVIPNVVDTTVFKPCPVTGESGTCRFLHVSSMKEEQKNITGIIRTIKRLSEIRHDFRITFIGDARDHQKELPRELGLPEGMITFKGEMTHVEVAENMQQSDVLVMFSRFENLPCVILEAWSCGLPVISSDVGGIRDWIREDNGLLVKPENEYELLNGLVFLLDHYQSFDRDALHRYAHDHFSQEVIARKFCDVYQKALKA